MDAVEGFVVALIALFCALIAEGLSYVMIYRTTKYKLAKKELEELAEKVANQKESPDFLVEIGFSDPKKQKKFKELETSLKEKNQNLSLMKMQSTVVVGITFVLLMSVFHSIFDGIPVARLPFEPISFVRGLSHRSLDGEDYYECSFVFLYLMCTMAIRPNLQKLLGFELSRAASKLNSLTSQAQTTATPSS
eukprot:m.4773 g.4773  ORF g.4773 m.4773 type:complete len:192 (-) comp2287_c0_seq1:1039-1614(-)